MLPCKITKFAFLVIFYLFIFNNESDSKKNSDSNGIHAIEAEFLKKINVNPAELKTDIIHHQKIPKYVRKLYKVMNELTHDPQYNEDISKRKIGTIRVYKPSGTIQHHKSVLYQLNKADFLSNDLTKAELVFRNRKHGPSVEVKVSCSSDDHSKQIESSNTVDGIIADVTNCLKPENLGSSLKFWIFATHLRTSHSVSLRQIRRMHPVLVIFQNVDVRGLSDILPRGKRDIFQNRLRSFQVNVDREEASWDRAESLNVCQPKAWEFSFTDIGWDWIIAPKGFTANICIGDCPELFIETYLNSTNYSFLKNLFHLKTKFNHTNKIPKACCSPVSYTHLTIMYLVKDGDVILKQLPDMRVLSCGCR